MACYGLTSQTMSCLFCFVLLVRMVTKAAQFQGDLLRLIGKVPKEQKGPATSMFGNRSPGCRAVWDSVG